MTTVLVLKVNVPALKSKLPSIVSVMAAAVSVPPAFKVSPSSRHVPAPVTVMVAVGAAPLSEVTPPSMPPVPLVIVPPSCTIVPVFVSVNVESANVPVNAPAQAAIGAAAAEQVVTVPVVMSKLASNVPVPAPVPESKMRLSAATGRPAVEPPLVVDQQSASVARAVTTQSTSPYTAKRSTALARGKSQSNERNQRAPSRADVIRSHGLTFGGAGASECTKTFWFLSTTANDSSA